MAQAILKISEHQITVSSATKILKSREQYCLPYCYSIIINWATINPQSLHWNLFTTTIKAINSTRYVSATKQLLQLKLYQLFDKITSFFRFVLEIIQVMIFLCEHCSWFVVTIDRRSNWNHLHMSQVIFQLIQL